MQTSLTTSQRLNSVILYLSDFNNQSKLHTALNRIANLCESILPFLEHVDCQLWSQTPMMRKGMSNDQHHTYRQLHNTQSVACQTDRRPYMESQVREDLVGSVKYWLGTEPQHQVTDRTPQAGTGSWLCGQEVPGTSWSMMYCVLIQQLSFKIAPMLWEDVTMEVVKLDTLCCKDINVTLA